MEDRLRNFYLFLLIAAVLLLLLVGLGHFWLQKLRDKMTEEQSTEAQSHRKKPRGPIKPHKPDGPRDGATSGGAQIPGSAQNPAKSEKPVTPSEQAQADEKRLAAILHDLQTEKPADEPELDIEEPSRWEDCRGALRDINRFLEEWIACYGEGKYFPSADPEGAVGVAGAAPVMLRPCRCNKDSPQEYVFVKGLPRDAHKALPGSTITVYESRPNSKGNRNVLFLDGSVEAVPEAKFQESLKKQEEELKRK